MADPISLITSLVGGAILGKKDKPPPFPQIPGREEAARASEEKRRKLRSGLKGRASLLLSQGGGTLAAEGLGMKELLGG